MSKMYKLKAIAPLIILSFSSCGLLEFREWDKAKKSGMVYKTDTLTKEIRSVFEDTTFVWVNRSYNNFE